MEPQTRQLRLPDGRLLAWTEHGDPAGTPVLYCHGFPSSGREAGLLDAAARAEGARLIAPDRPGYGDSDPRPDRAIADWPADLAALADHLGLGRFALVGLSGGGPYALACARLLPGRVRACALVCPLGPVYLPEVLGQMGWAARANFAAARDTPHLARLLLGGPMAGLLGAWPQGIGHLRALDAPPADLAELARPEVSRVLDAGFHDAMRHGARGALQDLGLYARDWGLAAGPLAMPADLWHGTADGTVPVGHGQWLQAHLPGLRAHYLPGEGHFSLPLRHGRSILRALLGAG